MDVAITGATGLIGSALARSLEADGHTVRRVTRGGGGGAARTVRWDPERGELDGAALEGVTGVVHLAGEGIASGRWTEEHRRRVHDSRVHGTCLLAEALAALDQRPQVLVSGSAIGWYGDRGDEVLTETSAPGGDFLAGVCRDWEAATAMAEAAGIRTCHIRTGIVLSADGGALGKQLLPYKLGLGGRAGSGRQWMSWISLADEVGAIRFLLEHEEVSGPVNLTAPEPVRNQEFARTLGKVLGRPTVLPIPKLVAKLPGGIGPLAENLLFASQRVQPTVLEAAGYPFQHASLEGALRWALDR